MDPRPRLHLALAATNGFHVEGVTRDEGNPRLRAEIGEPVGDLGRGANAIQNTPRRAKCLLHGIGALYWISAPLGLLPHQDGAGHGIRSRPGTHNQPGRSFHHGRAGRRPRRGRRTEELSRHPVCETNGGRAALREASAPATLAGCVSGPCVRPGVSPDL